MRSDRILLLFLAVFLAISPLRAQPSDDLVLQGNITGAQNNTYVALPFSVPAGTLRLTISFAYTGREQKTALDLGLFDPQRFRGWSGGNKSSFTLSETDATPSYLPGTLPTGTWRLIVGVPNIRASVVSHYTARIHFTRAAIQPQSFTATALNSSAGWYRGDLHMHTAHSDGSCLSQSGKKVPCPLFLTAEAAAARGLDFIAITDHNTISQYNDERELQPYFDKLLLIPGREVTTFHGHANVFGVTRFIDFRAGTRDVPDESAWMRQAAQYGAVISLNHPNAPSGEICMGCGWTADPPADMHLVTAIEAINGDISEGPYAGVSFWERELNAGFHLTGIGGSDNHNAPKPPDEPGSVGSPTTVVYAHELSVPAILDGIRSGRVFVDLTASRNRLLDVTAHNAAQSAAMGDTLHAASRDTIRFDVHIIGCAGSRAEAIVDGKQDDAMPAQSIGNEDAVLHFSETAGAAHWVRFNVRGADGKLQLLGNPVYLTH
ncbi:MAG: CehA/McbA family metallohydrolase [Acidobacteria bacterium]|nr:CehA/McbA family metallohydrolase [Acidobacteriota bacterium]